MPRLRLKLDKHHVFWYRWELLGKYTKWKKGTGVRIETVTLAKEAVMQSIPLGD